MIPTKQWTSRDVSAYAKWLTASALGASLAIGCAADLTDPSELTSAARHRSSVALSVAWQPTDHSADASVFRSELAITNAGPGTLATGWHLYFSFVRGIRPDGEVHGDLVQDLAGQGVRIVRADRAASGDYFSLEPLPSFVPLGPGEQRTIAFLADNWAILKTDAPAGFHLGFDGSSTAVAVPATISIDASDPKQTTRFSGDVMPVETAALRHAENPAPQALSLADKLLPRPRVVVPGARTLALRGDISVVRPRALAREAAYLAAVLSDVDGGRVGEYATLADTRRGSTVIRLAVDPGLDADGDGAADAEAYVLDVADGRISIQGSDAAGVFYGIQTLRQLIPVGAVLAADRGNRPREIELPEVHISDVPGFAYRGMHVDVARHFQSKATIEKLLDVMASYKLNKLHFHLADDEGWRLEIPGIPELTSYGARRGFDLEETSMLHTGLGDGAGLSPGDRITDKPTSATDANGGVAPAFQGFETATVNFVGLGSGYYTTREFEQILAFATERHIDVIPEFDVPGHARAAVLAMEHRYRTLRRTDPRRASQYRLLDPDDTSVHTSVQGYTDNFINPCLDSSYAFLSKVVQEVAARYRAAGAPLVMIHAGGDELPSLANNVWWQGSPVCKRNPATRALGDQELFHRFFTAWHQIITSTGAAMSGWDDIIHGGLSLPGFVPLPWSNVWGWGREDDAYRYANAGLPVIMASATNLYMDLAYNKDPDEPGYYWANFVDEKKTFEYTPFDIFANGTHDRMGNPIPPSAWDGKVHLTAAGKPNIIGMQGHLWAENLKGPEILEYVAFPKMLGVAERAWNPDPSEPPTSAAAWARFANLLGQDALPRLGAFRPVDLRGELPRARGVNYRIPLPGAVISNGRLSASVRYPGFVIEYSQNAGASWRTYSAPLAVRGEVVLRTRAPDGRTSRTTRVR